MTSIAFAGLTAAGKTTHAQRLAADLGYDYVSPTDILFEILRVPRDAHPWFNQADAISAARDDGAVDAELESRLVDLEIRYTHLERQVAELSEVVFAQQRTIDDLLRRLTSTKAEIAELSAPVANEKPPHY